MNLRTVAPALVLAGVAAASFFTFRSSRAAVEAPPAPAAQRAAPAVVASLPVEPLQAFDSTTSRTTPRRNVFAFEEVTYPTVARAPEAVVAPQPVVVRVEEPRQELVKIVEPPEENFPYRYIGRFGPDANPIAVFVANGEVLNARAGDSIAGRYRVRSIGLESVDVTMTSGVIRRVEMER